AAARRGSGGADAGSGGREPRARQNRVGPDTDGTRPAGVCAVGSRSGVLRRAGGGERGQEIAPPTEAARAAETAPERSGAVLCNHLIPGHLCVRVVGGAGTPAIA